MKTDLVNVLHSLVFTSLLLLENVPIYLLNRSCKLKYHQKPRKYMYILKAGVRKMGKYEGQLSGECPSHRKVAAPDHSYQEKLDTVLFYSILELYLTYNKLHIFKICKLISSNICIQLRNHHHNEDSEHIHHCLDFPHLPINPSLLPFRAPTRLILRPPLMCFAIS